MRDIEIDVLREVIEAVDALLRNLETAGTTIVAPRPQMYAVAIQAVIASARATGHYGAGSLSSATLLDSILEQLDETGQAPAICRGLT